MPKSAPKQKPQGSKKKMPMSILGLLGLALVLVGIVAAIGLAQINQDGRSQASARCSLLTPADQAECLQKNDQYISNRTQEENYKYLKDGDRSKLSPAEQAAYDKQAVAAARARKSGSGGSSSAVSIAPTKMRVECSGDKKTAKLWWDNKGKANTFIIGIDKINTCDEPEDGWMCEGDMVKTMNCTGSSCSYRFNVERGRYGTVAITAIKGDQRIESKLTKGFACK